MVWGPDGHRNGLGRYAGSGWKRLAGVHVERERSHASAPGSCAPFCARCDEYQAWGRRSKQPWLQASRTAENWARRKVTTEPLRSRPDTVGANGIQACREALLLSDA